MRAGVRGLIALGCVAAGLTPAVLPPASATPPASDPAPLLGPAVAGAGSYAAGTFVWTDYAYDDRGASSSPGSDGSTAYPRGLSNAADLIQVQMSWTDAGLQVTVLLETLVDPGVPVVGLGFDTDRTAATGAPALPGGGLATPGPLGLEELVVLRQDRSQLLHHDGAEWRVGADLVAVVDPVTNTMDVTIPAGAIGPAGSTWDAVAVAGAAQDGRSWLDGGPIADLGFVGDEAPAGWQSARQGDRLAGRGDPRVGFAAIDVAAMAAGHTTPAAPPSPGFHTRLYRSALDLGEGVGAAELTLPGGGTLPVPSLYAGPYQPYLVWVGENLPARPPVIVYLHGFSQTHTGNSASFGPPQADPSPASLLLGNGGFTPSAVVVFPLGRGEQTFYIGAAEQDVLDVTDDAIARFGADADRVVLSGVSMGGFGTFRLGTRYPDRWSAAVPFIGTGGSPQYEFSAVPAAVRDEIFSPTGFPTGNAELLENLLNVPVRMINGQADPIVNNVLVTQDVLRLDELGYDYRSWALLRRHHEVVPLLSDCVLTDAIAMVRDPAPARVVYAVEPALELRDPESGLDLRYDRAYWVSAVEAADGADKGTVDVTSHGRVLRAERTERIVDAGNNFAAGADLCGPNPAVRTGDAWRVNGLALTRGAEPASNSAAARLSDVQSATLDLAAMALHTGAPLRFEVSSDVDATLVLRGSWAGHVSVRVDGGEALPLIAADGAVTLPVLVGQHTYELTS